MYIYIYIIVEIHIIQMCLNIYIYNIRYSFNIVTKIIDGVYYYILNYYLCYKKNYLYFLMDF